MSDDGAISDDCLVTASETNTVRLSGPAQSVLPFATSRLESYGEESRYWPVETRCWPVKMPSSRQNAAPDKVRGKPCPVHFMGDKVHFFGSIDGLNYTRSSLKTF
jgi:hypothetical protein